MWQACSTIAIATFLLQQQPNSFLASAAVCFFCCWDLSEFHWATECTGVCCGAEAFHSDWLLGWSDDQRGTEQLSKAAIDWAALISNISCRSIFVSDLLTWCDYCLDYRTLYFILYCSFAWPGEHSTVIKCSFAAIFSFVSQRKICFPFHVCIYVVLLRCVTLAHLWDLQNHLSTLLRCALRSMFQSQTIPREDVKTDLTMLEPPFSSNVDCGGWQEPIVTIKRGRGRGRKLLFPGSLWRQEVTCSTLQDAPGTGQKSLCPEDGLEEGFF